jgi:hypothetical protein
MFKRIGFLPAFMIVVFATILGLRAAAASGHDSKRASVTPDALLGSKNFAATANQTKTLIVERTSTAAYGR